jgi:hypothetical protein
MGGWMGGWMGRLCPVPCALVCCCAPPTPLCSVRSEPCGHAVRAHCASQAQSSGVLCALTVSVCVCVCVLVLYMPGILCSLQHFCFGISFRFTYSVPYTLSPTLRVCALRIAPGTAWTRRWRHPQPPCPPKVKPRLGQYSSSSSNQQKPVPGPPARLICHLPAC